MSSKDTNSNNDSSNTNQEKKKKIDSSNIHTPHGSRKDVLDEINRLTRELDETQRRGKEKYDIHMEKKGQQLAKSFMPNTEDDVTQDIPIDGDFINGSRIFMRFCASCHTVEANSQVTGNIGGPSLGLIYGRKAGSDRFFNYKESYIKSQKVWTEKNLFSYLANTRKDFPDTRCDIPGGGLKSESDRSDLIRFLRLYTKNLRLNLDNKAKSILGDDYVETYKDAQRNINEKYYKMQAKARKEELD